MSYCCIVQLLLILHLTFFSRYENLPMQYTEIFLALKIENFQLKNFDIFLILLKHRLWVHVRTASASTHNLCFGAKIRKIGIPLQTQVLLYKSGVQGGIHCTDMFS